MKRYFLIDTVEKLKAISDPLRMQLLFRLVKEEYTGKQLGDLLGLAASKVHYHLRELENQGFIEVVRTEEKKGIMQKFFRSTAFDYLFSQDLLPVLKETTVLFQENIVNQLRSGISRAYAAPEESFRIFAEEDKPPLLMGASEIKAPRSEITSWLEKYHALLNELEAIEKAHLARIQTGEADDSGEVFYMVHAGFMTQEQHFLAADPSQALPDRTYLFGGPQNETNTEGGDT